MFLDLAPKKSILSDINEDLINTYLIMRDKPQELKNNLSIIQKKHNKDYYYWMRDQKFSSNFDKAVQFIYLNRTCWNGLYRVNLKGVFNVPIGTKEKVILDSDDFLATSEILKKATITHCDFEETIKSAKRRDLLFVDPPYTVQHNMNGFIKYNETLFSWEDQKRLKRCLIDAKERGVFVILTNADHESIRNLFADLGSYSPISRHSVLAGNAKNRGTTTEAIFQSWI